MEERTCDIRVVSPKNKLGEGLVVNCTSRSKEDWSKELSPFFLGPCKVELGEAKNMENAWQYSKVYFEHLDEQGNPNKEYYEWAKEGFANPKAVRFPMVLFSNMYSAFSFI